MDVNFTAIEFIDGVSIRQDDRELTYLSKASGWTFAMVEKVVELLVENCVVKVECHCANEPDLCEVCGIQPAEFCIGCASDIGG